MGIISRIKCQRLDYIPFGLFTHVLAYRRVSETYRLMTTFWDENMSTYGHNHYSLVPVNVNDQAFMGWLRQFENLTLDDQMTPSQSCYIMQNFRKSGRVIRDLVEIMSIKPEAYA